MLSNNNLISIYKASANLLTVSSSGVLSIEKHSKSLIYPWDIRFENISEVSTTGSAKVLSEPQLDGTTTIKDYNVSVTGPGDTISFTFKVVNEGNYNAAISSIDIGTPKCTGPDETSNNNVCGKLTYSLTDENGSAIQVGDEVYAKDYQVMKVTLLYQSFDDASLLPTEDVSISNLGITINYEQSNSAEVDDNGVVANNRVYHQGEKITLNNEDYWIIANSGAGQDYVVALKNKTLTVDEVRTYLPDASPSVINVGGYGSVTFGSNNTYNTSQVKQLIDACVSANFISGELKEVDGYSSRLITKEEYSAIKSTSDWRYTSYYTWIMNPYEDWAEWSITPTGALAQGNATHAQYVVRPVINAYKSAIENNND